MPILPQETFLYPADLLAASTGMEGNWWAIYTSSRQEKRLMRHLHAKEVAFYCPLVPKRSRAGGRTRTSFLPLFSSYVFVFGDDEARYTAQQSNCVSHYVSVDDQAQFSRDLQQIQTLIDIGQPLTPESRLSAGMPVRVRSGPFAGIDGVVVKRHSHVRLIVALNFLEQGVSIEMEDYQFEPLYGVVQGKGF